MHIYLHLLIIKKKNSFRKLYIYELTIKHVNYQC
jgi:hypothetical protein